MTINSIKSKLNYKMLSTVVGVSLMLFPTELYLYWGNLSIYTLSYFLANGTSPSTIESPWIMSTYFLTWSIVIPLGGHFSAIIGRRTTLLVSIFIYNMSIALCYFTIDISYAVFTIVFGVFRAIGSGISHALLMEIAVEHIDVYVGTILTIVGSAMSVGGAVINQFITIYTNPNYLVADWKVGPNMYFSQVEIIKRIPQTYLIFALMSVTIQLLGFVLIRRPNVIEADTKTLITTGKGVECGYHSSTAKALRSSHEKSDTGDLDCSKKLEASKKIDTNILREIFTCKYFYIFWFISLVNEMSSLIVFNYYKQIGQLVIKDEEWLTLIGSISILVDAVFNVICGFIIDVFGARNTYICLFSTITISSVIYVMTPRLGKLPYGILTYIMISWISSQEDVIGAGAISTMGPKHFTLKYGLVWSSALPANLCGPPLISAILNKFGFYILFDFQAILNSIALIVIAMFLY